MSRERSCVHSISASHRISRLPAHRPATRDGVRLAAPRESPGRCVGRRPSGTRSAPSCLVAWRRVYLAYGIRSARRGATFARPPIWRAPDLNATNRPVEPNGAAEPTKCENARRTKTRMRIRRHEGRSRDANGESIRNRECGCGKLRAANGSRNVRFLLRGCRLWSVPAPAAAPAQWGLARWRLASGVAWAPRAPRRSGRRTGRGISRSTVRSAAVSPRAVSGPLPAARAESGGRPRGSGNLLATRTLRRPRSRSAYRLRLALATSTPPRGSRSLAHR